MKSLGEWWNQMKINNILFRNFAGIENKEVKFYPKVNVLFGRNEMGKSTVSKAILHLLYGIYPANKNNNPYVNWYNNALDFQGEVNDSNENITVHRYLKSQPMGEIIRKDKVERIANQSLVVTSGVPMWLYDELYCLDTRSIDAFSENAWERINENLIFSYNNSRINNPQRVIEKLKAELNELWRDSNRGHFKLKTLKSDIRINKEHLRKLKQDYLQIKDELNEMQQLEVKIDKLESSIETIELKEKSIRRLLPISDLLLRKSKLNSQLKSINAYKELSKNHLIEINRLEEKVNALYESKSSLHKKIMSYKEKKQEFNSVEKKILSDEKDFFSQVNALKDFLKELKEYEKLAHSIDNIREKYNSLFYKIFNKIPSNDDFTTVYNTSVEDLTFKEDMKANYIYLLVGFLLVLFAIIKKDTMYVYMLIAFLSGFIVTHLKTKKPTADLKKNLVLSKNDLGIFRELKAVEYELLRHNKEREKNKRMIKDKKNEYYQSFTSFFNILSFDQIEGKVDKVIPGLKEKKENNNRFDFLIEESNQELALLEKKIQDEISHLEKLNQGLMTLGGNNIEECKTIFENNSKIMASIKEIDDQLRELPQYNILLKEYNECHEKITLGNLDRLQSRRKGIEEEKMAFEKRLIQLKEKIENENISEDMTAVQSRIAYLMDEKDKVNRRKNELLAMIDILKSSNEAFKRDFEPAVIKKANEYFSLFTQAKYDKIFIDRERNDIKISVSGLLKNPQEGFSRGTLDQLFLALRLSVIEYYEDETALPIIFDEFFSNWDNHRLEAFLKSLKHLTKNRQVIFMTCKQNVSEKLQKVAEAKLIKLDEVKA